LPRNVHQPIEIAENAAAGIPASTGRRKGE
jgi:hypothetical protein